MFGHPTLRRKLRRDVLRQWPQFASLIVTVLLGVGLYAASTNAYQNLADSYQNVFTEEAFADLFVTGGRVGAFASSAAETEGVQAVTTRIQADLPFTVGGTKLEGRVLSYPTTGTPEVNRVTTLSGAANPSGSDVLVEHHMADDFGLVVGDRVAVAGAGGPVEVRVGGIVSTAEFLWPSPSRQEPIVLPKEFGVIYASPELSGTLAGSAAATSCLVLLTDAARAADGTRILDQLATTATADGATDVLTRAEQPSNTLLQEDIDGFQQMALAFPILFLSAAGLSMYVLLTRRVQSERPVIGTFRAQGMRGRTVAGHYLQYGLCAGVAGAVLGLPLGIFGGGVLSRAYTGMIELPAELVITDAFRWQTITVGFAFAVIAGALAVTGPAVLAAHVAPAEAMRGEAPDAVGGRTLVERVFAPMRQMSARRRLILRSIARNPKRSVFTASGVAIALILVLVSWLMIDTMNSMINRQFDQVDTYDGQATYAVPVGERQVSALKRVDGITAVESAVQRPISLSQAGSTPYATQLTAFVDDTTMHGFYAPGGAKLTLPDDGILVNESITSRFAVKPGDSLTMTLQAVGRTPAESRSVTIAGFVDEPTGTLVYSSIPWLDRAYGNVPRNTALVDWGPGVNPDSIGRVVADMPGVVAFTNATGLKSMWDEYAGLFYLFVGAMLALGGLMAFAIISTTMTVNIIERRRELGMFRAAGVRQRTLAGLVAGENVVVAALGVVPGIVLGIVGADVMLASFTNDQFSMHLVVQPATLVIAAAVIMLVAVVSELPGLRKIKKMDIAQVVRERSE